MKIAVLSPQPNWVLSIIADDGRFGNFDVSPYLEYEAFEPLRDYNEFQKVFNGGYFIEWDCGADLSADTIEARWQVMGKSVQ
ncbi:MAG: DUF2442 domain-containing protein [Desulfobacteraceae bacterium]|nr:MAG: DUF2442 domain-containing protein [Desulfobacteraceae bacterium]